jgi:hypothetical protein
VKRTRGDEPIGVAIYICLETTQGNSLCSYLYLKLAKVFMFLFLSYVFSSTKLENGRVPRKVCVCGGLALEGEGSGGERSRRMNMYK